MAEGGVGDHGSDRSGIEGGAPVVSHRGGLERQPRDRGYERNEAGDEREAASARASAVPAHKAKDMRSCRRPASPPGNGRSGRGRARSRAGEISAPRAECVPARGPSVLGQHKLLAAPAAACDPSHLHPAHPLHAAGSSRPDARHRGLDFDRAGMFEIERRFDALALSQGMRQMGEHQMLAVGREPDRAVRGNVEPAPRPRASSRRRSPTSSRGLRRWRNRPSLRSGGRAQRPCFGWSRRPRRPRGPSGWRAPRAFRSQCPGLELLGEGGSWHFQTKFYTAIWRSGAR
jgi:hypothetical protein